MTPAELLERCAVFTPTQVAVVLNLHYAYGSRKGEPDPRKARELIRSGALRLVDPTQPVSRWAVSQAEVRRYIAEGPRMAVAS